jgi:TPR repeat protein
VKWYQKAADQGYASAQHNLGFMYAYGEGVLKDLSKAKYWIKKAYENPSANSKTKNLAEENWNELELWKY